MGRRFLLGTYLLFPCLYARSAVSVMSFGALANGLADDSPAIQKAVDSSASVYLPSGTYRACDIRITHSGTRISGDSSNSTILVCPYGIIFKNYTGQDGDAVRLDGNTFTDISIENLSLQGGENIISDYLVASGRAKSVSSSPGNTGIRWKQSVRNTVRNCAFQGFERAMDIASGFGNTWEQNRFLGNQIGVYYDTGWAHGDVEYKVTTNNSHRNQFSNNRYGVFSVALVDNSVFLGDIFEMNNTALYLGNSSLVRISAYFEKNWEGVVFAGQYTGINYIQNSDFVGSFGEGNWGGGRYVNVLAGTPSASEVRLLGIPFFNSGNARNAGTEASGGQIVYENPSLIQSYSFAKLPPDGSAPQGTTWMVYCPDCKRGATCVGGGTGAIAKYLNQTWDCN